MSYDVDIIHEAILAVGAVHRASLGGQEALRFKVLGFRAYGNVLKRLPNQLTESLTTLIVLVLLTYFEVRETHQIEHSSDHTVFH